MSTLRSVEFGSVSDAGAGRSNVEVTLRHAAGINFHFFAIVKHDGKNVDMKISVTKRLISEDWSDGMGANALIDRYTRSH